MTQRSRFAALLCALVLSVGPALSASTVSLHSAATLAPGPPAAEHSTLFRIVLATGLIFGAIRIKDTASLSQKFVQRASAAVNDYTSGVQQAGQDWETGARNGEPNYEAGVQEAISKKRFGRGIAAAGAGKYVANATKLGGVRYGPGVQNAQDAWARGVGPALEKLKGLVLPPKGPRRSPQNQQRANMVALELGKLKDGQ
jgi:hypothetical protein